MLGNLVLTFLDSQNKKRNLTIREIPETVDPEAVKALVELITVQNFFGNDDISWYQSAYSAKLVLTTENVYFSI